LDIQGLRAVAVGLVVAAHAGVGFLAGGFVGVDVFFVLSGFLITGLLLREARTKGRVSLVEFYVRRARRILPAAALTLLATDAAAYFLLNFVRAHDAVVDSVHAAGFAANFQFAARGVDYFAREQPPSPILHFWSLSVEEQFYFVWPVLVLLVVRRGYREGRLLAVIAALTAASLAYSIYLTASTPTAAYFSPFTRAWELGLGATLAVATSALTRIPTVVRTVAGWIGITAVACSALLFTSGTPFPGAFALVPTLGTALAIVAGMGNAAPRFGVGRLLAARPMCMVGDRSYALYLWHWPILIVAGEWAGGDLGAGARLGLVGIAFAVSCITYALVGNPIRHRMRSRLGTALVAAACMVAVLGTAKASLAAIGREQQRFDRPSAAHATLLTAVQYRVAARRGALPAVVAAVEAARRGDPLPLGLTPPIGQLRTVPPELRPPDGCILHASNSQTTGKICRVGTPSSARTIVLVGDSHANMWLPPLLELARRDGWALVPLIRLGCNPTTWVTNEHGCRTWHRWSVGQALRLHAKVTVLGGSIDEQPGKATTMAAAQVVAEARDLRRAGLHVVVIGDPEGQSRDPVDCLLASGATMASCTTTWPRASLAAYDLVQRRTTALGAGFLPTRQFVCFESACPTVIDNTIAWMDTNHLTAAYTSAIAAPFRAAFLEAVGAMK
jgi:peptidoglycan/LPS O-acetylase OafA/YrhL